MKEIIFILAPSRSGSTVFSKFLGMHSRCFSLSEPRSFDVQIQRNSLCSCGEHYHDCLFWNRIQQSITGTDFTTSIRFNSPEERMLRKILKTGNLFLFLKFGFPFYFKDHDRVMRNNALLLHTVSASIPEEVIIDASKDVVRALYLSRLLKKEFRSKFVLLFRDPVANVYSKMKSEYKIRLNSDEGEEIEIISKDPNRMELHEAIKSWNSQVQRILQLIRLFRVPCINVVYERFATDPKLVFDQISSHLGLSWEDSMLDLESKEHHLMGGNSSRINARIIHKPKEEWRNLSEQEIELIRSKTRNTYDQLSRAL